MWCLWHKMQYLSKYLKKKNMISYTHKKNHKIRIDVYKILFLSCHIKNNNNSYLWKKMNYFQIQSMF